MHEVAVALILIKLSKKKKKRKNMYRPGEPLPRRKYGLHRILWLIP